MISFGVLPGRVLIVFPTFTSQEASRLSCLSWLCDWLVAWPFARARASFASVRSSMSSGSALTACAAAAAKRFQMTKAAIKSLVFIAAFLEVREALSRCPPGTGERARGKTTLPYSALPRFMRWVFSAPLCDWEMLPTVTVVFAPERRPAFALPMRISCVFSAPLCRCVTSRTVTLDSALLSKEPFAVPISIFCVLSAPDWVWFRLRALTVLFAPPSKPLLALPTSICWVLSAPDCDWLAPSMVRLDSEPAKAAEVASAIAVATTALSASFMTFLSQVELRCLPIFRSRSITMIDPDAAYGFDERASREDYRRNGDAFT